MSCLLYPARSLRVTRLGRTRGVNRHSTCILAALMVSTQVLAGAAIETDVRHADLWADSVTSPEEPSAPAAPDRELKLDYSTTPIALHVTLEPASEPQPSTTESTGGPIQIAFYREIPEELQGNPLPMADWTGLDAGTIVTSMSVTSPGAVHIRLGLHVELPPGGEFRFFVPGSNQHFPVVTEAGLDGLGAKDRLLWSPLVQGDSLGVEIVLPSQKALSNFTFSVKRISHGYIDLSGSSVVGSTSAHPKLLACPDHHVDVACRAGSFLPGLDRSVARFTVQKSSGAYVCTGTLLSDRINNVFIPYFLTAYHCVSTQAEADSVVALWHYKRRFCGHTEITPPVSSDHLGTELLDFSSSRDSALLRFKGTMPRGLNYAGWSNATIGAGRSVIGLHHPRGTVMKYSAGRAISRESYGTGTDQYIRNAYVVNWDDGATEPGSSGSGLFILGGILVGVSSAWDEVCGGHGYYGAFQDFWPVADRWLFPTTATTLAIPSLIWENVDPDANDYFKFHVPEDGRLLAETAGTADTVGTLLGLYEQQARDDNSGSQRNFRIDQDVQRGTYHLEVRGRDVHVRGAYALQVLFEPHDDDHGSYPENATLVQVPSSTAGRLEREGDLDYFRFTPPRAGTLQIETAGGTDTVGTLLVGARELGTNDDGGDENNFRIISVVPAGLQYTVKVQGHDVQREGNYTLNVRYLEPVRDAVHTIPLFMADGSHLEGFARIINRSSRAGTVEIRAIDETGKRFGPISLSIDARQVVHFNSGDLEQGNPGKGLSAGVGSSGTGHWRLELSSELQIEARAYNRSPDGFLTSIHEVVEDTHPSPDTSIYNATIFNPGDNTSQVSVLRLINPNDELAEVFIAGYDDVNHRGPAGGNEIYLELEPGEAVAYTARQLEQGDSGFSRFLGDGTGKWQLWVTSNRPLHVMSLLRSPNGKVANLSR